MNKPLFYPPAVDAPATYRTDEFVLRPLGTDHVEIDYAALMVSKEMLRRWGGSEWPADDFDLEGNLADLAEHQQEHEAGVAYTFTMLDPSEEECLGCVYIAPLFQYFDMVDDPEVARSAAASDYEAVVRFWVKQPRLIDNLDRRLFSALITWFSNEWAFSRVLFRVNSRDLRQVSLVQEADLSLRYTLEVTGRKGHNLLFGDIRPSGTVGQGD